MVYIAILKSNMDFPKKKQIKGLPPGYPRRIKEIQAESVDEALEKEPTARMILSREDYLVFVSNLEKEHQKYFQKQATKAKRQSQRVELGFFKYWIKKLTFKLK